MTRMSNGALPKATTSKSSVKSRNADDQRDPTSDPSSEFLFELKPKPKLTCIPENSGSIFFNDLKKTQSMNLVDDSETPEKSWSVLYIGSKNNIQTNSLIM